MKKTIKTIIGIILLTAVMFIVITGCTQQKNSEQPKQPAESTQTQEDNLEVNEYTEPSVDKLDSDFEALNDW